MAAAPNMVIKVNYGGTLRRFNVRVDGEELDLSMDGLREKISSLFGLSPETELNLTYIDEDGDVVTLADGEDLRDVVKQSLNPLRITAKLKTERNGRKFSLSSGSSTPLRSPSVHQSYLNSDVSQILKTVQEPLREVLLKFATDLASKSSASGTTEQVPFENLNSGVSQILRAVQEPVRETLVKLTTDVASNSAPYVPSIAELVDNLSKVGLSYLDQISVAKHKEQPSMQSDAPESSTAAPATKDFGQTGGDVSSLIVQTSEEQPSKSKEGSKKPQSEPTTKTNEVKNGNVTSSSKPSGSKTTTAGKKKMVIKTSGGSSSEKSQATNSESSGASVCLPVGNNNPTSQEVNKPSKPHPGPKIANVSTRDTGKVDYDRLRDLYNVSHWSSKGSTLAPNTGNSNFPGIPLPPPYPFAGIGRPFSPPPCPASQYCPVRGGSPYEGSGMIFHHGVGCDGCDVNPIRGPRFKSKVKDDFDLCESCFSSIGKDKDYIRMDYSASQYCPVMGGSPYDGNGVIFHRGVRCDGCGAYPITGPRFNSKIKEDFDLCEICFSSFGKDKDYIRMDFPSSYHTHKSFNGLLNSAYHSHLHGAPTIPLSGGGLTPNLGGSKLNSHFIQDVNVIDGTSMVPLTPFTKIWRMRNNGTVFWPQKTQLVWIGGDRLCNGFSFELQIPEDGIQIAEELDVAADFTAPELPGRYISYWRMASPSGQKFGQRVWVLIQVDASLKETHDNNTGRGFNLNSPPMGNDAGTGPDGLAEEFEPNLEDGLPQPDNINNSYKMVGSVQLISEPQPNVEHEKKFPINDTLLVGSGASSTVSAAGPSVSYPNIILPHVEPVFSPAMAPVSPPSPPRSVVFPKSPVHETPDKLEMEEKLLKELENMGFVQVELNKEMLRLNEYDLEKTVYDLCGVEWDPMLEELQEMGFADTEMNKMLMKKNNGSIKRVVMDLIAGEK